MSLQFGINSWGISPAAPAIPDSVVNWDETSDLSDFGGDTGDFQIQSTTSIDGDDALESLVTNGDASGIASTTGLNRYPEAGERFRCWMYSGDIDDDRGRIYFGTQSEDSWIPDRYQIGMDKADSEFVLWIGKNDESTKLDSTNFSWADNTWYDLEIEWGSNGTIVCRIFDTDNYQLGSIEASDETFSSGGIGFQSNPVSGDSALIWDTYRIVEVL